MVAQTIIVGAGDGARNIAYIAEAGARPNAPGLFWLSGFMSDMGSTKATAIADWARQNGLGATRFDYSGHGLSQGVFTDGTIGRWLEEAMAVFTQVTAGPQVIIGSSMGGYLALLLLRALIAERRADAQRIKGLVLIAPAWDMTEELMWKQFPEEARRTLEQTGVFLRPAEYDAPYPITRELIEEGRRHLLARVPFKPGRPVVILQGLQDSAVPAAHTRELVGFLKGGDIHLIEIADGEHRLSRPEDLEKLLAAINSVLA